MRFLDGEGKSTTLWHEWLGLLCVFVWFFSSMYSYYDPFYADIATVLLFMLLLCAGLFVSALLWSKQLKWMENALPVFTLTGAVCTGLIPFLPISAAITVFWISGLLMTPLLCRRLYGVLLCARENIRMRVYISAVSVTIIVQMLWVLLLLPYTVKFPVLTVFALVGLWRSRARLPGHTPQPLPKRIGFKMPLQIFRIVTMLILIILLNQFNTLVHGHVVVESIEGNDLFFLVTWFLAPVSFLFYAYFTDKKRERLGFSIGLALILMGCFAALTPGNGVMAVPLLLTGEFGGTITEFCFLTMPLLFFTFSKRPFLIAVSGLIVHTFFSAVGWTQELWLPHILLQEQIERPLIIFGAVCVMALIPLAFSVWRRQEDAALMAALLGWKTKEKKADAVFSEPSWPAATDRESLTGEQDWMHSLDFLEGERHIALLLCEGFSRAEIAEMLAMPVLQVSAHLRNIRAKLDVKPPVGCSPLVLDAASRYGLTNREREVFSELLLGRSNAEISANLYITDATVKTHVNKIMKKTGMSNRTELIARVCEKQDTAYLD